MRSSVHHVNEDAGEAGETSPSDERLAKLVLVRGNDYFSRWRGLKITVDGRLVAKLRSNRTRTVSVTPGPHELRAHIDWVRSAPWIVNATAERPIVATFRAPMMDALTGTV